MTINVGEVFPELTLRQREVCARLIQGYSHKEIAKELSCSHRTIEDHVQEILQRCKVWDSRRLIYRAFGSPEVIT